MTTARPVAVITGASRGIGAATARELGRRGYHAIVNYRASAETARKVASEIEEAGGAATPIGADVTDPEQVRALTEEVTARFGGIDVLVCNANTAQPPVVPLAELSWPTFMGKISDELAGVFHITQEVLRRMRARGSGRIVFVSSVAATSVGAGWAAHSTAEAALNTFGRYVAAEAGQHGIAVNTIMPGLVRTDATTGVISGNTEWVTDIEGTSVLGRVLEPEDVASVIGALSDPALGAVAGTVIRVDSGHRLITEGRSPRL